MEENEELVLDETENVEETTEETLEEEPIEETEEPIEEEPQQEIPEEMFTQDQVNEMVSKRLARKEAKIRKEYARKYGRLETVVNAGLDTNNIDEAVEKLTDFYTKRGIKIPNEPQYSDRDLEVLARDDADEIILVVLKEGNK